MIAGMRWILVVALACAGSLVCSAHQRHWQTGTWTDVGLNRDPFVGGEAGGNSGPVGEIFIPPQTTPMPEVGRYVIETADLRLEIQDVVPIGHSGPFDASARVGAPVTFALENKVVYVRMADGTEHRLRVIKESRKKR
jgi:hypothetical protein